MLYFLGKLRKIITITKSVINISGTKESWFIMTQPLTYSEVALSAV